MLVIFILNIISALVFAQEQSPSDQIHFAYFSPPEQAPVYRLELADSSNKSISSSEQAEALRIKLVEMGFSPVLVKYQPTTYELWDFPIKVESYPTREEAEQAKSEILAKGVDEQDIDFGVEGEPPQYYVGYFPKIEEVEIDVERRFINLLGVYTSLTEAKAVEESELNLWGRKLQRFGIKSVPAHYRVLVGGYPLYSEAYYYKEELEKRGFHVLSIYQDAEVKPDEPKAQIPIVPAHFPALINKLPESSNLKVVQIGQELDILLPVQPKGKEYLAKIRESDNESLSAGDLLLKGENLIFRKQVDAAEECFNLILEKFADTEYAGAGQLRLGYLALRNKDKAGALKAWGCIVNGSVPATFDTKLESAIRISALYHRAKEREKSLVAYKEIKEAADRVGNGDIAAYTQLQIAGLSYELAKYWWTVREEVKPKYRPSFRYDTTRLTEMLNAQKEIKKVVADYPNALPKIHAVSELMYLETISPGVSNQPSVSLSEFAKYANEFLQKYPGDEFKRERIAVCYWLGQAYSDWYSPQTAIPGIEAYKEVISEKNKESDFFAGFSWWRMRALLETGKFYQALGNTEEAKRLYQEIIEKHSPVSPQDVETARRASILLEKLTAKR